MNEAKEAAAKHQKDSEQKRKLGISNQAGY